MGEWHPVEYMSAELEEQVWAMLRTSIDRIDPRVTWAEISRRQRDPGDSFCLWVNVEPGTFNLEACAFASVKQYESGLRVFSIEHAAGTLNLLRESIEFAESQATRHGCHRLQVEGRPGWGRVLGEDWQEFSRSFEREISYG